MQWVSRGICPCTTLQCTAEINLSDILILMRLEIRPYLLAPTPSVPLYPYVDAIELLHLLARPLVQFLFPDGCDTQVVIG